MCMIFRDCAVQVKPYASLRMSDMAEAFGASVDELQAEVVQLVDEGAIPARFDSHNRVRFGAASLVTPPLSPSRVFRMQDVVMTLACRIMSIARCSAGRGHTRCEVLSTFCDFDVACNVNAVPSKRAE